MHQDTNVRNLHRNSILCEECCIKRAKKKRKKSTKHSSSRRCSACGARIELAELDNPCLHADFLCFHHRPCCQCDKRSGRRREDTSTSSSSDSSSEDSDSILTHLLCVPTDTKLQNLFQLPIPSPNTNISPASCSPGYCPLDSDLVVEPRTSAYSLPSSYQVTLEPTPPPFFVMPAEYQCPPCSDPSSPEARSPNIGAPSSAPERHNMPIREPRIPQLQIDRVRLQNTYAPYGNNDFCAGGMHGDFPPPPPQFSQFPSLGDLSLTSYMKLPEPQRPHHHFERIRLENNNPQYENSHNIHEDTSIRQREPVGHSTPHACRAHGVSPPPCLASSPSPAPPSFPPGILPGPSNPCARDTHGVSLPPSSHRVEDSFKSLCSSGMPDPN